MDYLLFGLAICAAWLVISFANKWNPPHPDEDDEL